MNNELIDYTIVLNEILDKIVDIEELIEYIKLMLITIVSLNIFDFVWKKIRQPKRLRGGVDG